MEWKLVKIPTAAIRLKGTYGSAHWQYNNVLLSGIQPSTNQSTQHAWSEGELFNSSVTDQIFYREEPWHSEQSHEAYRCTYHWFWWNFCKIVTRSTYIEQKRQSIHNHWITFSLTELIQEKRPVIQALKHISLVYPLPMGQWPTLLSTLWNCFYPSIST